MLRGRSPAAPRRVGGRPGGPRATTDERDGAVVARLRRPARADPHRPGRAVLRLRKPRAGRTASLGSWGRSSRPPTTSTAVTGCEAPSRAIHHHVGKERRRVGDSGRPGPRSRRLPFTSCPSPIPHGRWPAGTWCHEPDELEHPDSRHDEGKPPWPTTNGILAHQCQHESEYQERSKRAGPGRTVSQLRRPHQYLRRLLGLNSLRGSK